MKKLCFYLLYISLIFNWSNIFAMQYQIQSDSLFIELQQYHCDLQRFLQIINNKIYNEEYISKILYYNINTININQYLLQEILVLRQEILCKLLNAEIEEINPNILKVQGQKLFNFLKNTNITFQNDLWLCLERNIQEYCKKGALPMNSEMHGIFNSMISQINYLYLEANEQRLANNLPTSMLFFNTQRELNICLNLIVSYANHKIQLKKDNFNQTEKAVALKVDSKDNFTQTDSVFVDEIKSDTVLVEQKEESTAAKNDALEIVNLQNVEEPVKAELQVSVNTKQQPTKKERAYLKKQLRQALKTKEKKECIAPNRKTEDAVIHSSKLQEILLLIEKEQNIDLDKLNKKISKLESKEDKEYVLYELLLKLIKIDDKAKALRCIEIAPKTPKFLLQYIKIVDKLGLTKENINKFCQYIQLYYSLGLSTNEIDEIIKENKQKINDDILLLHLANLEINIKNNILFFIKLFNEAISKNLSNDFIHNIIEAKTYNLIIKWVNDNASEIVKLVANSFIFYANTTINLRQKTIYLIDLLSDLCKEEIQSKSNYAIILDLPLEIKKNWVKLNIKLLQAIINKIDLLEAKTILTDLCINVAYDLFNDFIIPIDQLKQNITFLSDENQYYINLAKSLERKDNACVKEIVLECYRISANRFNDTDSIYKIIKILQEDFEENKDLTNKKNIILELENWYRILLKKHSIDQNKCNFAQILLAKKDLGLEIDKQELIDNLHNNSLFIAKVIYYNLVCDNSFNTLINPDPKNLTNLIISSIHNYDMTIDCETIFLSLMKSLVVLARTKIKEQCEISLKAAQDYFNSNLELTDANRLDLERIIYQHPFFNKLSYWHDVFKEIQQEWELKFTNIKLENFLEDKGLPDISRFFKSAIAYDLELKQDEKQPMRTIDGHTVLYFIVSEYYVEIIKFLLLKFPELITINDNNNNSVAVSALTSYFAIHKYDEDKIIEVLELLKSYDDNIIKKRNIFGATLLHVASEFGYLKVFKYIIEKCNRIQDIDTKTIICNTPLDLAICFKHVNILKYILTIKKLTESEIVNYLDVALSHNSTECYKILFSLLDNKETIAKLHLKKAVLNTSTDIALFIIDQKLKNINCKSFIQELTGYLKYVKNEINKKIDSTTDETMNEFLKNQLKNINSILIYLKRIK